MKLILMAGSLRKNSFNKQLVRCANELLKKSGGVDTEVVELNDFDLPLMNEDLEEQGLPSNVVAFNKKISSAQALILSSPEYNGSISSPTKNAIDWLSRNDPHPFRNKPVLLMAATPGGLAGVRGLWHTRVPLEALGAFVFADMFGLGQAHSAFDESDALKDPKQASRLNDILKNFVSFSRKLS